MFRFVWTQGNVLKEEGIGHALRWNAQLTSAWVRDRLHRRRYSQLDEAALRAVRRSDTVFLFGTGASLNELTPLEWEAFTHHDVLGFNDFHRQRWIPVDFHLLRGGIYGELRWRPFANEVVASISSNPMYEKTILLVQEGLQATFGNRLVGYRLLRDGTRISRYRNVGSWGPPTRRLDDGLRSVVGTLESVVNLAYVLGWKQIILVGIDLYDNRHFFLPPDQVTAIDRESATVRGGSTDPHGFSADDRHATVTAGVVELLGEWREVLAADGVELRVYNPRSLLAEVMPVYERVAASREAAGG